MTDFWLRGACAAIGQHEAVKSTDGRAVPFYLTRYGQECIWMERHTRAGTMLPPNRRTYFLANGFLKETNRRDAGHAQLIKIDMGVQ